MGGQAQFTFYLNFAGRKTDRSVKSNACERAEKKPRNNRPNLGVLQGFAKTYFRKPPVIKWKQMKDCGGEADLIHRIIYLSPDNPGGLGCDIGRGLPYQPQVKFNPPLSSLEKYYLTLLHEIAHFKIRNPMPKSIRKTIRKLKVNVLESEPHLNQLTIKERIFDEAGALPMMRGEKKEDYEGRIEIVRHWIYGMDIVGHLRVENWAIKEFRRLRNSLVLTI